MKNIPLLAGIAKSFMAKVIWSSETERDIDQYILFRKKFVLKERCKAEIFLFANTYYNLYMDGVFLHRGPFRRHEMNAFYDKLICDLGDGEHTIAVLVHYLGVECAARRKASPAFWAQIQTDTEDIVAISDETWKAQFCSAFMCHSDTMFSHYDFCENIDMRKYPKGWEGPGFDDSQWQNAIVLSEVGQLPDIHCNYVQRPVKLFSYDKITADITLRGGFQDKDHVEFPHFLREREYYTDDFRHSLSGSFVVAALECSVSATVIVEYSGARSGCEMVIGYDDRVDENGIPDPTRLSGGTKAQADRIILCEQSGCVKTFMPRGFRYVVVSISDVQCKIDSIRVVVESYPYTEHRPFVSGNSYFSRLYEQSARTQRVCTIDGFTDCVSRERVLWLGDAYMDCLGNYYGEPDRGLLLATLFEHAAGQRESGALGGYNSSDKRPAWLQMAAYNLQWLNMLCDYILFTDDLESVMPLKDTALGILRFVQNSRNEDGIIDSDVNKCSTFWDWGYEEPKGESLKVTAYYIQVIERLKDVPFFRDIVSCEMVEELAQMRKTCFERFWDKERRVFHDSGKHGEPLHPLSTQNANIQAIAAGICPESLRDELLEKVFDQNELDELPVGLRPAAELFSYDKKILPCATMYGAFYITKALFDSGLDGRAIDFMETVWRDFDGLPTLPEIRRNGKNEGRATMCHGWSAAPAFLLPMYVLGLRPMTNGWKKTLFAPPKVDASVIPSAKGVVKTPYGELIAQWTRMDGAIKLYLNVPEGIQVCVKYEGREYIVDTGCTELYVVL